MEKHMQLKIAEIKDIDNILKLHAKYQLATIKEEDKKGLSGWRKLA